MSYEISEGELFEGKLPAICSAQNSIIDMVLYSKQLSFNDIVDLVDMGKIDTVYVRRVDSDEDMVFEVTKPSDMEVLDKIMSSDGDHLVGWRVLHNHVEESNFAAALAIQEEEIEEATR